MDEGYNYKHILACMCVYRLDIRFDGYVQKKAAVVF